MLFINKLYINTKDQNNNVLSGTGFKGTIEYFKIYEGDTLAYSLVVQSDSFHDEIDDVTYNLQNI